MPRNDETTNTATDIDATEPSTPRPVPRLEPGTKVSRYEVGEVVGTGGMGVVYRAHDPELKRDVAIKVMASKGERNQKRLLVEGRAMAKLSHPNVVPVFDVGVIEGGIYVVMPHLSGGTLHDWIHAKPRPWREVLERFVAAGRGLAAAHDAGLVHRDFKPRNVLLDGEDVLVADFGLVASDASAADGALGGVTTVGGTPGYMAPEQARGEVVDARADQFSFCISLWEGLHGMRPQESETRTAHQVLAASYPPIPVGRKGAPRWLLEAVARGFSSSPRERWPSLQALLDYVAARIRRPRRLVAAAAAVIAVCSGVAAIGSTFLDSNSECPDPSSRLATIWNPSIRSRVESAFLATKVSYASDVMSRILPNIDERTRSWRSAVIATCQQRRTRKSADVPLDLRSQCLERWRDELSGTVVLLHEVGDRSSLDGAVEAARSLSPVEDCMDEKRLGVLTPPSPEQRAEADAIATEILRIELARRSQKTVDLTREAAALTQRARAMGHDSTLARTLKLQSSLLRTTDDSVERKAILAELSQVAARSGDDRTTAWAWTELVEVNSRLELHDEGLQLLPAAYAAVARAGNPADLRSAVLINEAGLIDGQGEPQRALELLNDAEQILVDAGGSEPGSPYADLLQSTRVGIGAAYGSAGDYDASVAAFRRAIEAAQVAFGPAHPSLGRLYLNTAESLRRARKFDEALKEALHGRDLIVAGVGKSSALMRAEKNVAGILYELDRPAESLAAYDRTLELAIEFLDAGNPVLYNLMIDRSAVLIELKRFEDVITQLGPAIAFYEKRTQRGLADALLNRAAAYRRLGRFREAATDYERAIETADRVGGGSRSLVLMLVGLGRTHLLANEPSKAIAPLERAVADQTKGRSPQAQRIAAWLLGRARVEAKRDVARGMADVKAAREVMAAAGDEEDLVELDAWLATQKRPR